MTGLLSGTQPDRTSMPAGQPAPNAMQPQPQPQAMAAGADGEQTPQAEGETPNATPEEQAQYNKFVDNALSLIYDKKSLPVILKNLAGGGDPVQGLATTTVSIVSRLNDSARQKGVEISADVLLHGGIEILQDLADTSEKAGIHKFTPDEVQSATYKAMDLARETFTSKGELDPNAMKQEFAGLVQADKAGKLNQIVPGLDKAQPMGAR